MGMDSRIECIFFSEFHPTLGPKITYQVGVYCVDLAWCFTHFSKGSFTTWIFVLLINAVATSFVFVTVVIVHTTRADYFVAERFGFVSL